MKTETSKLIMVTLTVEHPGEVQSIPTHRPTIFIVPELVEITFDMFPEGDSIGFRKLYARGRSYRKLSMGQKDTHRIDEVTWKGPKLDPDLHDLVRRIWRER